MYVLILLDGGLLDRPGTAPAPKVDPTVLSRFNDLLSSTDTNSACHDDCVTALRYLLRVHLAFLRIKMVLIGSSRHANTSFLNKARGEVDAQSNVSNAVVAAAAAHAEAWSAHFKVHVVDSTAHACSHRGT